MEVVDVDALFPTINKMEEKRSNFLLEASAIHDKTVEEWNTLYEALIQLTEKYKDSEAFKDSQLRKRFFEPADTMAVEDKEATAYVTAKVREVISDVQHDIWAHWMKWVFKICPANEDGSVTIPVESVTRWQRQIETPYDQLSEKEKDGDREQADKILVAMKEQR